MYDGFSTTRHTFVQVGKQAGRWRHLVVVVVKGRRQLGEVERVRRRCGLAAVSSGSAGSAAARRRRGREGRRAAGNQLRRTAAAAASCSSGSGGGGHGGRITGEKRQVGLEVGDGRRRPDRAVVRRRQAATCTKHTRQYTGN